MATLELDWVHEGDIALEAKRIAAYLDIDVEVVTESGPGGGWPILRFTADRPTLVAILFGYDDTLDPDEIIPRHTVKGGLPAKTHGGYGVTHDMDCPGCQDTSYTSSPRSETYWSS